MTIESYAESFAGKRVVWYNPDTGATEPPGSCFYRLGGLEYGQTEWTFESLLDRFLSDPKVGPVVGIVIGAWNYDDMLDSSEEVVNELVNNRERLPHLRALFFGDILREECEISWINQSNMTPLLTAFPALEHFRVRGANGLRFIDLKHDRLQSLSVESGGLHADVIRDVLQADLPNLEHLELWLGSENYGAPEDLNVLQPLFRGEVFPKLRYLGLRNSEQADEVAAFLARAEIVDRIKILDLSLGTLSDDGVQLLMQAALRFKGLEKLDLHHHYISPAMMEQVRGLGITVDLSEVREADGDYRYNYASE